MWEEVERDEYPGKVQPEKSKSKETNTNTNTIHVSDTSSSFSGANSTKFSNVLGLKLRALLLWTASTFSVHA